MKSEYLFSYCFETDVTTEIVEMQNFADCLRHAANNWHLLEHDESRSPDGGMLTHVQITHVRTNYVVATLDAVTLSAIYNAVIMNRGIMEYGSRGETYAQYQILLTMGGEDFKAQAIKVLNIIADICLEQFNVPDAIFPVPPAYLSTADAKRDLQYLTEFCKIAAFQLNGDTRSW